MELRTELWVKGTLCLIGMALVLWRLRRPGKLGPRDAGSALVLFSMVCAAAYLNFGRFHGAGMVHHWEQFHYVLGSKYFPEVGYDGLYVASMGAQLATEPDRLRPTYLRDLRNNQVVETDALSRHGYEVRQRFSDARWQQFTRDHKVFLDINNDEYLAKIRTDHGYNPTPTWTFTARLFSGWGALSDGRLLAFAWIDLVLFAALFVVVF